MDQYKNKAAAIPLEKRGAALKPLLPRDLSPPTGVRFETERSNLPRIPIHSKQEVPVQSIPCIPVTMTVRAFIVGFNTFPA